MRSAFSFSILIFWLASLSVAVVYKCENDLNKSKVCVIPGLEETSENPVCRMKFPNEALIQLKAANLEYLSPMLLYRMFAVEKLHILNSYVAKAYVKPGLDFLIISDSQLNELQIDPGDEHSLVELHLPGNELELLPKNLNQLKNLIALDLSRNRLQYVDMAALDGLPRLATLRLNDNQIKSVFATGMVRLKALTSVGFVRNEISLLDISRWKTPHLECFYVANNRLERLHGFPEKFHRLRIVSLSENPWECDWFMKARDALMKREVSVGSFHCAEQDSRAAPVWMLKQMMVSMGATDADVDDIADERLCRMLS